jgi:hypothetical protein
MDNNFYLQDLCLIKIKELNYLELQSIRQLLIYGAEERDSVESESRYQSASKGVSLQTFGQHEYLLGQLFNKGIYFWKSSYRLGSDHLLYMYST